MTKKSSRILAAYRKQCGTTSSHAQVMSLQFQDIRLTSLNQLVLPESFKLFPTYVLCMLKNLAFRAGANVSFDKRLHMMRYLNRASVKQTMGLLYPRLFQLHPFPSHQCKVDSESGFFVYPTIIRNGYSRLEPNGVYLIENGLKMIIWVGQQCPPAIIQALFGVNSLDQIDIQRVPSLD